MLFSFKVNRPADLKATFINVKKLIEESGGSLVGDEHSGQISSHGVEGTYKVKANSIEITVNKKPTGYPEFAVKSYITKVFKKCSV